MSCDWNSNCYLSGLGKSGPRALTQRVLGRFISFRDQNDRISSENEDPIWNEVSWCYNVDIINNICFEIYEKIIIFVGKSSKSTETNLKVLGNAVILVPKRDESTQYSWSYKPGTDLYETAEIPVWVPVTAHTKDFRTGARPFLSLVFLVLVCS